MVPKSVHFRLITCCVRSVLSQKQHDNMAREGALEGREGERELLLREPWFCFVRRKPMPKKLNNSKTVKLLVKNNKKKTKQEKPGKTKTRKKKLKKKGFISLTPPPAILAKCCKNYQVWRPNYQYMYFLSVQNEAERSEGATHQRRWLGDAFFLSFLESC